MKPSSTQWMKEARQIAWPWSIMMGAGLLVLARPWFSSLPDIPGMAGTWSHMMELVLPIGAFFGTAILAALPLGSEFQYRTLAMRLAQPIDRDQIWRQKFFLTIVAVAPPAVIYCIAISIHDGRTFGAMTAVWILITMFGVIPATLLARSIIGGIVLNEVPAFSVSLGWMYFEKYKHFPTVALWAAGVAVFAYAAVMVWLGRRMLVRFQAADGMQAAEDFVPGAQLVPDAIARWFQCRPQQPIANLIRREFRLSRVLWVLVFVYLAAWMCLVVFHLVPDARSGDHFVAFGLTALLGLVIAVLAGTLSLGEDKNWGTHDWHMTLPLSITTQWMVKLLFAVGTSLLGVALLPMGILLLGHQAGGDATKFLTPDVAWHWVLEVAAVTFIAFWSASVVKNTIQATLWVFPLCFGMVFAGQAGPWVLGLFDASVRYSIGGAVARLDPIAVARYVDRIFYMVGYREISLLVIPPLLGVALIQSLRAFRMQFGANKLRVVRFALPLMMVTFLWGVANELLFQVLRQSWQQSTNMILETDKGIGAVLNASGGKNAGPRQISAEELAQAAPLSEVTKRWLANATITVTLTPERKENVYGRYVPGRMWATVPRNEMKDRVPYSAMVHHTREGDCSMMFHITRGTMTWSGGSVIATCE